MDCVGRSVYDPEVGLYHAGARCYNAVLGRFMGMDPLGQGAGVDVYAYVGNDPLNATDPSGLDALVIIGGQRSDSLNVFGHVSVAETGGGIYSFGTATSLGSSVSGFVNSQSDARSQTLYTIKTTPQQDAAMISYRRSQTDNRGLVDNCAARTCQALNAGGILNSFVTARTPEAGATQLMMSGSDLSRLNVPQNTSVGESVAK